jgi:hypothetical protein
MMRSCSIILAVLIACGVTRAKDGEEPTVCPPSTSGRGEGAPALVDRFQALRKEVEDAESAYLRASEAYKEGDSLEGIEKLWRAYKLKADENVPKTLQMIRNAPRSSAAFEVLDWIMTNPRIIVRSQPYVNQAIELLRDHHPENPNIGRICSFLGGFGLGLCDHPPTMEFLRSASEKNPNRTARGQATLALARLTHAKGQSLEYARKGDSKQVSQEAERLFESVVRTYGDCPDLLSMELAKPKPHIKLYERTLSVVPQAN